MKKSKRNIVLFVGNMYDDYVKGIQEINKEHKGNFRIALLCDVDAKMNLSPKCRKLIDYFEVCNPQNLTEVKEKLEIIKDEIISIHIAYEKYIEFYIDVLKIMKVKNYSSPMSLMSSVDKLKMRKAFCKYDPLITPKFIQVKNRNYINIIEKKIGYPCILKPAHLIKSKLVSVSNNREELKNNLYNTFNLVDKIYNEINLKKEPVIVAEEMMDGKMYTTDVYVSKNNSVYFTPPVYIITGKNLGIDDFHNYARIIPSGLNKSETRKANLAAKKSVLALGLKNTVAHIELMQTNKGWKIIELGPRIGGYRMEMLKCSYGIDHLLNSINIRINKKPIIKNKLIIYSAVLELFSYKKGFLKGIKGIEKIKKLSSFFEMNFNYNIGDVVGLSKDGYKHVINIFLKNKNKNIFYEDLERLKKIAKVEVFKKI